MDIQSIFLRKNEKETKSNILVEGIFASKELGSSDVANIVHLNVLLSSFCYEQNYKIQGSKSH